MAVRVVQPGLLGLPRRLLVPISGYSRSLRSGLPFLKLFLADVLHLQILYVEQIGSWRFRMLSHESAELLRRPGEESCKRVEQEVLSVLEGNPAVVDGNVVVSDNLPMEIIIAANKSKSRLIYMGFSERKLSERFFCGDPIEQVLRHATCDVAIYRGIE